MKHKPPSPATPKMKPPRTTLNDRELAFVDAYRGNKTQAAIEAGYAPKNAGTQGQRLYQKTHVREAIRKAQQERHDAAVMDRIEMQKLFSSVARDQARPIALRLKAAELLGKTRGDFTSKLELQGNLTVHDLAREALEATPG